MINKSYIEKIQSVFNIKYFRIYAMYDAGNSYMFGIQRKGHDRGELLDPWYLIDKKTKKIKGFAPHHDLQLFKQALANKIDF